MGLGKILFVLFLLSGGLIAIYYIIFFIISFLLNLLFCIFFFIPEKVRETIAQIIAFGITVWIIATGYFFITRNW